MGWWGGGGGEGVGGWKEEGSNTRAGFVSAKPESEWREMKWREKHDRKTGEKSIKICTDIMFSPCMPACSLMTLFPTVCFSS